MSAITKEEFNKLDTRQKERHEKLNKIKETFFKANQSQRRRTCRQQRIAASQVVVDFRATNKLLEPLKTTEELKDEDYFIKKVSDKFECLYGELADKLDAYVTYLEDEDAEKLKKGEKRTDDEESDQEDVGGSVQLLGKITRVLELMQKDKGKSNLKHLPEPFLSADAAGFMAWKKRLSNYLNVHFIGATDAYKYDLLLKLVDKNDTARKIVKKFETSDEKAFQKALDELTERFTVVRTIAFNELSKLFKFALNHESSTSPRELYDTTTAAYSNFQGIVKLVADSLSIEETDELELLRLEKNLLMFSMLFNSMTPKDRSDFSIKKELEPLMVPDFEEIWEFIKQKFINGETREPSKKASTIKVSSAKAAATESRTMQTKSNCDDSRKFANNKNNYNKSYPSNGASNDGGCLICSNKHDVASCRQLLNEKDIQKRKDLLFLKKICIYCLKKYGKCKCRFKPERCSICSGYHHAVIHRERATVNALTGNAPTVVRPTVLVHIENNGKVHVARALLDTGATDSVITYELAKKLNIELVKNDMPFTYFNGAEETLNHSAKMIITPHENHPNHKNVFMELSAFVANKIDSEKAYTPVNNLQEIMQYTEKGVLLADPKFTSNDDIELVIGVDEFRMILKSHVKHFGENSISLQDTKFGYVCMGKSGDGPNKSKILKNSDRTANVSSFRRTHPFFSSTENQENIPMERVVKISTLCRADAHEVKTEMKFSDLAKFFIADEKDESDEEFTESQFQVTRKIDSTNRFVVRIPFRPNFQLGLSKRISEARVRSSLRRMTPEVRELYYAHNLQLIYDGYLKRISDFSVMPKAKNYIANNAVLKESSTTPLRVIYTCDQKTSNGLSINDVQFKGRKLQTELPIVLLNFRMFKAAATADISKMYLQMQLDPEDALYQHTFIGRDPNGPLEEVQLPTVIFGMKSSPFLALRTLKEILDLEANNFPMIKNAAEEFYVDDFLTSENSPDILKEKIRQICSALDKYHFVLRKWASNNKSALKDLSKDRCIFTKIHEIDQDKDDVEKVSLLGLEWNSENDVLQFKVNHKPRVVKTRRDAASIVAIVFNPLGFLAPVVMVARLIMRNLYLEFVAGQSSTKDDWNQLVKDDLANELLEWYNGLIVLDAVRLNRWVAYSDGDEMSIFAFCDASTLAYGCAVYLRVDSGDNTDVNLIGAKGKLIKKDASHVPKKVRHTEFHNEWSLPRAELMAAALLADYLQYLLTGMRVKVDRTKVYCFSDSQITLAWIQGEEHKFNTFVANRTREIKKVVPASQWFYVPTKENIADIISRGCSAEELVYNECWWKGPTCIKVRNVELEKKKFETDKELKQTGQAKICMASSKAMSAVRNFDFRVVIQLSEQFSSLDAAQRVLARWYRFFEKVLSIVNHGPMVADRKLNYQKSLVVIIKSYQLLNYSEEMACLIKGREVSIGSIRKLKPYLDVDGLMRVGGRLEDSRIIPFGEKHPIILPRSQIPHNREDRLVEWKSSPLTKKIILMAHASTMHGGEYLTLTFIRSKYFIPNARKAIRYMLENCVKCRVILGRPEKQLMGNLPRVLSQPAPPFYHSMVDCFGPYFLRKRYRKPTRNQVKTLDSDGKAWGMVFVCRITGAYHIELVDSMTAEAAVASFRRFVGRRSLPRSLTSDCGTNFTKAAKILKKNEKTADEEILCSMFIGLREVQKLYAHLNLEVFESGSGNCFDWSHHPPGSPRFAGKVEAAVKQIKLHKYKVVGDERLTFSELNTLFIQIEAVLNSRPLGRIEGKAGENEKILTPSHFLTGRQMNLPPDNINEEKNLFTRWEKIQLILQSLWSSWRHQYLHQINNLPKEYVSKENIKEGELVLIKDDNKVAPTVWKKGVVVKVRPGLDGKVRVVDVEVVTPNLGAKRNVLDVKKSIIQRSVTKIVRLPVFRDDQVVVCMTSEAQRIWESKSDDESVEQPKTVLCSTVVSSKKTASIPNSRMLDADNVEVLTKSSSKIMNQPKRQKSRIFTKDEGDSVKPPLRRSARLASKMSSLFSVLSLLCLIMCAGGSGHVKHANSSVLYFQDREVLIKTGVVHSKMLTNLSPKADLENIEKNWILMQRACDGVATAVKSQLCQGWLKETELEKEKLIRKISKFDRIPNDEKSTSTKQKRETGAFWKLLNWLFAFNDTEETDSGSTSTKTMIDSLHIMEKFEKDRMIKDDIIQERFNKLIDVVNAEKLKWSINWNLQRVNLHLMYLHSSIVGSFKSTEHNYNFLSDEEAMYGSNFQDFVSKLNREIKPDIIPRIGQSELFKLTKKWVTKSDGKLNALFEIPIVQDSKFIKFLAFPLPVNEKITSIGQVDIIANLESKLMLDRDATLVEINETLSVTSRVISKFNVVTNHSDCAVAKLFGFDGTCKWLTLPVKYDVWYETPVHNLFAFYSNVEKEEICLDKWTLIKETSGVINMQENCIIKTETAIIQSKKDKTNIKKHVFKINHELVDIKEESSSDTGIQVDHLKIQSDESKIEHLNQLEKLKEKIYRLENHSVVNWSCWFGFILLIGFSALVVYVIKLRRSKETKKEQHSETEMKEWKDILSPPGECSSP